MATVRCRCTKELRQYAAEIIRIRYSILSLQRQSPHRPRLRQRWIADGNKKGIIVEDVDPRCIIPRATISIDKHNIVHTSAVGTRHIFHLGRLFRWIQGKRQNVRDKTYLESKY